MSDLQNSLIITNFVVALNLYTASLWNVSIKTSLN